MPWIANHKQKNWRKINKKFPVLQSCRPRTGGPVGISNTGSDNELIIFSVDHLLWNKMLLMNEILLGSANPI